MKEKRSNLLSALLFGGGSGGGGGGGDTDLASLEIYIADFITDPPTITDGALDGWHRILVA